MEELHPPGTRIERLDPPTNMLLVGTVMNIPLQSLLFLRAIHPRYEGLLNQFASKQKDLLPHPLIRSCRMRNTWMVSFLLAPRANQVSLLQLLVLLLLRLLLPIKTAKSIALHGSGWRRTRQAAFHLVGAAP